MYDAIFIISGVSCNKTKIGGWGFSVYDIKDIEHYEHPTDSTIPAKLLDGYYLSNLGVNRKWHRTEETEGALKVLRVRELIERFGSTPEPTSIVKTESHGFLEAIKLIDERQWKNVLLYCDSRYVAQRLDKLIKAQDETVLKRKDGKNIITYDLWSEITTVVLSLLSKKINIKWQWVTDTLTKDRMEYSKLLARKGQALAFNGKDKAEEFYPDGKKKVPESRCHGFLLQSRMYFIPSNINVTLDGKRYYFCGNHGDKDEWCGKPRSDSTVSVFILDDLDLVMELLMGIKREDNLENHNGQVIKLDNVRTAPVRNEIITYHKDLMIQDEDTGNIENYAGKSLLIEQRPPYLYFRLFDKLSDLFLKLNDFNSNVLNDNTFYIDITNYIFPTTSGGNKYLHKHWNTNKFVNIPIMKINATVTLTIGIELLSALALRRIIPENPIVRLYIEKVGPLLYKYWVFIKTSKAVGLFTSTDANSIFRSEEK